MKDQHGRLRIHPEILKVMGEYLVSDPVIAISELVKNSYDADATEVFVRICTKPSERIIVEDNGHGMTMEEIDRGWLVIGTPMKRERDHSKLRNRVLTGSMGIGRLAAFSLADIVEVETAAENEPMKKFSLDLKELLNLKDISDFNIPFEQSSAIVPRPGTKITLSKLKWHATQEEMERLVTRLSILCSPAEEGESDFSIIVDIDGLSQKLTPVSDLPSPPISISATVDSNGIVRVSMKSNPNLYLGDLHRKAWSDTVSDTYKSLAGVKLNAFWYPLGERAKGYWRIPTRNRFAQDMREGLSGVRVYRDGIRVLPYGEPENDWLDLERTYVSGGSRSRNPRRSQIVAWIRISREGNPSLMDTANREGLVENSAFIELKTMAKKVFALLAEYRRIIEPVVRKEHELTLEDTTAVERVIAKAKSRFARDAELLGDFSTIERYVSAFKDQLDRTSLYRDRLTGGNLISHIVHDVGAASNKASDYVLKVAQEKCNLQKHSDAFQIIEDLFPRILSAYDILKGGSRAGAQRVSDVEVSEVARKLAEQMRLVSYLPPDSISVESKEIVARLRASDFWAIIANLLVNAVTCSEYEHARGRDFPKERRVVLSLEAKKADLTIICEDNGPGLPDKPEDWLWQPFNSTRKGSGSGLGLYIISDIVTYYGGTKRAEKSRLFKTGVRFEIILEGVIAQTKR